VEVVQSHVAKREERFAKQNTRQASKIFMRLPQKLITHEYLPLNSFFGHKKTLSRVTGKGFCLANAQRITVEQLPCPLQVQ
jgi:hypothetical protein